MKAIPVRSDLEENTRATTEKKATAKGEKPAVTPARQKDTAQYVADMILELRNLARAAGLHTVMVPLEYAYYEAFSAANRVNVPPEEVVRINALSQTLKELEGRESDDY